MRSEAIVAGTGFDGRAALIRAHVREGMPVQLRRDRNNSYDANAVGVWVQTSGFLGLFGKRWVQIGYIKARAAEKVAKKLDDGIEVRAQVRSFWAPPDIRHPRVSLVLGLAED